MCDNEHPDYEVPEVSCPDDEEGNPQCVNEECREGEEQQFCNAVGAIRNNLIDKMALMREGLQNHIEDCNGDLACIAFALWRYDDRTDHALTNYETDLVAVRLGYTEGVLENCCESCEGEDDQNV